MSDSKYCSNCGTLLQEGSMFCSRCGRSVAGAAASAGQAVPPPYPRQRGEKGEKEEKNEKDQREKNEKDEKGEKGGRESWVPSLFGGLVLIWLGITALIAFTSPGGWSNWGYYFLIGLGVILILEGIVLGSRRGSYSPYYGFIIGGVIVALIGLTPLYWSYSVWPYIIIILGIFVILIAILGRRRTPRP